MRKYFVYFTVGLVFSFYSVCAITVDYRQVLPRLIEYAAIASANKELLDFRQEVGCNINTDLSEEDLKMARNAYFYNIIADLCRLVDGAYSVKCSLGVLENQKYRDDRFACENAYQYDLAGVVFDLGSLLHHICQRSKYKRLDNNRKLLKEDDELEAEDLFAEVDQNSDLGSSAAVNGIEFAKKNDQILPAQVNVRMSALVRALCIYVFPAIESGCAAISASSCDKVAVKDSTLRSKVKALQFATRLFSEALMCRTGSKKIWVYAVGLVVVAVKLFRDWGMEKRANVIAISLATAAKQRFDTRTEHDFETSVKEWKEKNGEIVVLKTLLRSNDNDLREALLLAYLQRNTVDVQQAIQILQGDNQFAIQMFLACWRTLTTNDLNNMISQHIKRSLEVFGTITHVDVGHKYRELVKRYHTKGKVDEEYRTNFEFFTNARDFLNEYANYDLVAVSLSSELHDNDHQNEPGVVGVD